MSWWVLVIGTTALLYAHCCVVLSSDCPRSLPLPEAQILLRSVWLMAQHHCVAFTCLPESEFQLPFFFYWEFMTLAPSLKARTRMEWHIPRGGCLFLSICWDPETSDTVVQGPVVASVGSSWFGHLCKDRVISSSSPQCTCCLNYNMALFLICVNSEWLWGGAVDCREVVRNRRVKDYSFLSLPWFGEERTETRP